MATPSLPDTGWCGDIRRGAAMGRGDHPGEETHPHHFYLRNILTHGAYDAHGAYWGFGQPVFWATTGDLEVQHFFRAQTRRQAKAHILGLYPNARFYR